MDIKIEKDYAVTVGKNNEFIRTAHDYGVHFAESTLKLMPTFLDDVRALATTIESIYSGEI